MSMKGFLAWLVRVFWYVIFFGVLFLAGWFMAGLGVSGVGQQVDDVGLRQQSASPLYVVRMPVRDARLVSEHTFLFPEAPARHMTQTVVQGEAHTVTSGADASLEKTQQPVAAVLQLPIKYSTPPLSFDAVHTAGIQALVNILCLPTSGGSTHGITASGVVIDPRGVILTNAHVAQYFLLKSEPQSPMRCEVRTGAPARARFIAELLFIPSAWVGEHAGEYKQDHSMGTGEHDYALLLVTGNTDGMPLITAVPFLTPDTREALVEPDENLLVLTYPAGFLGGGTIKNDFWPVSTIAQVKQLLTFRAGTVDLFSLGGTIVAQGGSSGGPVVNQWGRLVGIAVTATEEETTDKRDLRAVALSHIDESMKLHTGLSLAEFLAGDLTARLASFQANNEPVLRDMLTSK